MNEKVKILHLEDSLLDAELICSKLETGGITAEIDLVTNYEKYIEAIEKNMYDLILSDYSIPMYDGLSALYDAKKRIKNLVFIFCSGTIGEQRAVQCLQNGAADYVLKDNLDQLVPAIKRALKLVTEIKEKEKAVAELKKIHLAVENTAEAIFMTDSEGIIQFINPAFTKMYGWNSEEVIGKVTPRILKSGVYDQEFYTSLWENLVSRKPTSWEIVNVTKDGSLIEVKNTINPVIDRNNNLVGYVSVQNDISLKKEHERELLKAKKEAEEMNKLKTYFLSNISHEMRTPLISILGFSELLLNEINEPEQVESIRHIYDNGRRLQETITSILSLQEIEKKETTLSFSKFNLNDFIKKTLISFEPETVRKGIFLQTNFEAENIFVSSDQIMLKKVLLRILDNSLKFTPKGEISVSVTTEEIGSQSFAVIKIADTGIGISREKIELIFSVFRQESEGFDRDFEGMGLGLYIVRQILALLKGVIEIESEVDKGTTVTIKIPELPSEKEIKEKTTIEKNNLELEGLKKTEGKPRILVVEDNESNRLVIRLSLKKLFEVDEAEDGITGISQAELNRYDLILMDINLGPGIDGVETFHRIRKLPGYENIPVIAITAYAMPGDKQKFLDFGFTKYMEKPVMKEELISSINELLKIKK